jgi:hypothetical protein
MKYYVFSVFFLAIGILVQAETPTPTDYRSEYLKTLEKLSGCQSEVNSLQARLLAKQPKDREVKFELKVTRARVGYSAYESDDDILNRVKCRENLQNQCPGTIYLYSRSLEIDDDHIQFIIMDSGKRAPLYMVVACQATCREN